MDDSFHMAQQQVSMTATGGFFTTEVTPDLYLIIDSIPDGLYGVDSDSRIVLINRAGAGMLGYEPQELIGRGPHQVMHHARPDGSPYPADECPLHQAIAERREIRVDEDLFWRRDGSSFPVEYESHPLRRNGAVVGFIVTFRDISARKKNEERLRDLLRDQFALAKAEFQHAQLRDVLKQTPAVICVTRGPRHLIEVVNDQFMELVGDVEVVGKTVAEVLPAADDLMVGAMTLAYETGVPQRGQELAVAVQTAGGPQTRFFDYIYQPLRDESGYIYGLMTHAVDVTEEVQSRRALETRTQELEGVAAHLRLAAEAGRLGTWEWELPSRRVIWSPEIERIHGLELGTFPGTFEAYQADLHPEDRDRVLARVEDTIANRSPYRVEYRIVRPDGEERWIEARGQMFLGADGEPERVVGICMDVTDRKRAEVALLEQNRLSTLTADVGMTVTANTSLQEILQRCAHAVVDHLEAAVARIWTLDSTTQILELQASAGMYTHLDGPHSRVPVGNFKIGLIAKERQPHLTNDVQNDPRVGDREWAKREGMRAFAGYPLMLGDELVGVLAMFARRELSHTELRALATVANGLAVAIERKRAERALRARAEELTHLTEVLKRTNGELDAFAYAASHDLRAPLRGIANLAQWIEEDLTASGELKPDTREMLALMRTRMHRMEALIEGILQYSRAGRFDTKIERVDTRKLVREVIDLMSAPGATFEIGELPELDTTVLPLQQVFMNLIGNAVKYAERPDPVIRIEARDEGRSWEFSVSDNGPGIPPEYHDRIWGIFQTLEARDKVEATGIGLSLVKKLVEAAGGRAWVESTPGVGATFRFLWPKQIRETVGS